MFHISGFHLQVLCIMAVFCQCLCSPTQLCQSCCLRFVSGFRLASFDDLAGGITHIVGDVAVGVGVVVWGFGVVLF